MSRLKNLSHIDFEDLCRDLAQADTGKRFSAFGPGPDGGVDGRHSKGEEATILQSKHYVGSTFPNLKSALEKELENIKKLNPKRYLFFTSQSLTPSRSNQLAEILGDYLQQPEDIWGLEDIEGALRRHPKVEKSHMKLWLSSTAVLERILQSGLEAFTQSTKAEILDELKVYVRNPSFDEAIKRLERERILIISGPPGVGKTTLAKMVAYHYLNEGWQFYAINSLDDGFAKIDDEKPTIFFFDDFLGRIELNRQALLDRDTALATFVKRVKKSKNARFILTTRAHIFEEARRLSDHMDDARLQLAKYLLDVGAYTRKIKSQILFNHLFVSDLSQQHFASLMEGDWLKKIVDHKNYNPRVIASVSSDCLDDVDPKEYPGYVFTALENPDLVWSKPYRALNMRSQNLLIALFFGIEFGQEIDELQANYSELHRVVCTFHSQPTKPDDFEDALKSLESGFISISGKRVNFVNPSVRDFLKTHLTDIEFLKLLPSAARRADWAQQLWRHVKEIFKTRPAIVKSFASAFSGYAQNIEDSPTIKRTRDNGYTSISGDDQSVSSRVDLLLEWWESSQDDFFIQKAVTILTSGTLELVSWRDGQSLPESHWWVSSFVDDNHPSKSGLISALEKGLVNVLDNGVATDELVPIVEAVNEHMSDTQSDEVAEALDRVVKYEFTETSDAISHLDSEQGLSEHMEFLDELAKITGYDPESAKMIVSDRLVELEEPDYSEHRPSISSRGHQRVEDFDDSALKSLFSNLLNV